jgi:ribonuclease T1
MIYLIKAGQLTEGCEETMVACRLMIRFTAVLLTISLCLVAHVYATSCEEAVSVANTQLSSKIDAQELVDMLRTLNHTGNKKLPPKFVTKYEARSWGWKPGSDLWSINKLKGSSIGGDSFNNLEGRLPKSRLHEADLDYKGGHRGGKRLVFSKDGRRFVTVNHYRTFVEIPACR